MAANRRCFFADILVSVIRGWKPGSKFGMETMTAEAQDAASSWLDSLAFLAFDNTKTLLWRSFARKSSAGQRKMVVTLWIVTL